MTDFPVHAVTLNVASSIVDAVELAGEKYKVYATLSPEYTSLIATDPISILVSFPQIVLDKSKCHTDGLSGAKVQAWKIAVYLLVYWEDDHLDKYMENVEVIDDVINLTNAAVENLVTDVPGGIKLPPLEPLLVAHWGETDNHNILMIGYESDRLS